MSASQNADTPSTRMKKPPPIKISHSGAPNCCSGFFMNESTRAREEKFPRSLSSEALFCQSDQSIEREIHRSGHLERGTLSRDIALERFDFRAFRARHTPSR